MNDEQLGQSPNAQANENTSTSLSNGNGNAGVGNEGQELMTGSVGKAQVGDVDAPTQGFPMTKTSGEDHPAPQPSTRDTEPLPAMEPAQADALTSYHPVEPIGETPEQGIEAKAEGDTQAAAQMAPEIPETPATLET